MRPLGRGYRIRAAVEGFTWNRSMRFAKMLRFILRAQTSCSGRSRSPSGHPLAVELEAGEQIYVVGPNGSGKSALLQHLATSSGENKIRRIFAHRQTWLNSDSLTLTPESRRQFERNRRVYETAQNSLWIDHTGAETHAAVLFDLVAAENKRARSITKSM